LFFPVQLAQQLEDLIQRPLHQHIMQEMLDEAVHGRKLDDFALDSLRWIALSQSASKQRLPGHRCHDICTHLVESILEHDRLPVV
jgi:hypothetical protein